MLLTAMSILALTAKPSTNWGHKPLVFHPLRVIAIGLALLLPMQAHATTRVYLIRGLLGWLVAPMNQLATDLQAQGATVEMSSWADITLATAACTHRNDRLVFVAHSLGAPMATAAAALAQRLCGARVRVIAIDPVPGGQALNSPTTAFIGPLGGTIAGAHNIRVQGHNHIGMAEDEAMRQRIVTAVMGR